MTEVSLREMGGFPAATANIAEAAATPLGAFRFGIEKGNLEVALRTLADDIASGAVLPQNVVHAVTAKVDDFVMHSVSFEFAARRE